ncbi:RHOMBOID-like protein 12, mitochondrial [Panicum miliaceum]|uniref:RHOMBOID-like protein 12, mitochondrial n=1 Tax=Panicum miliaceum TaxID=4540 RepID=A0A3L6QYZ6_PANMI|nr:RHOMBOID-like protein 12, mitochondrial [Panicum miliaceum]
MRRKLLQFQSLLAQHALRGVPKPRPQLQPHHHRLLHSPSAPSPAPPSPSAHLLWNRLSGGTVSSLLPRSAAAVAASARTAASRWLSAVRSAGSLDLFSLQRRRKAQGSGWKFASSTFLQGAPWAYWMQSPDGVVLTLVGVNVAVFMLWRVADPGFMRRHFMISLDNFKSGRLHTLLTSAFSHAESDHLISNMIGLYFFGTSIARTFGPAFLLKLYVAGALTGSAFFMLEKAFLAPRKQVYVGWDTSRAPALGASAAVNATILLQIFLNPKGLVYLYFLIPIPAAFMGAGLIAADLYRVKKGQGHVSGSAHLGGALVAALVWARIRKGWI